MRLNKIIVAIYGMGHAAEFVRENLRDNVEVSFYVKTKITDNEKLDGVIQPKNINNKSFDYIVCAGMYRKEMRDECIKHGVKYEQIILVDRSITDLLNYPSIFNLDRIIANQNREISELTFRLYNRNKFYDSIKTVSWVNNISFSPSIWSVGYVFLYYLYQGLTIVEPKRILEMGLGESSKMTSQYSCFRGSIHTIIEHDESWIESFCKGYKIADNSRICSRKLIKKYYDEFDEYVNAYEDISGVMNVKYGLIIVDGPFGSKDYSRGDIVDFIPDCLEESFCLMVDDSNRAGEKRMVEKIENKLREANISFKYCEYRDDHDCFTIIVSENNRFLLSK